MEETIQELQKKKLHPTESQIIQSGAIPGFNLVDIEAQEKESTQVEILSACVPCLELFDEFNKYCFSSDIRGMNLYYNLIDQHYAGCELRFSIECPICVFYQFYKEKKREIEKKFFKKKGK